jgi:hypothetical protein
VKAAKIIAVLTFSILIFFACYASPGDSEFEPRIEFFEFRSGGACHISGLGEWTFTFESDGTIHVSHDVGGEMKDYGGYILTDEERSRLLELAQNFDEANVKSSVRMGVADEVMYIFIVKEKGLIRAANIWIDDAREIDEITKLVDYIGILIEKYTGEVPVLR